ncbi:MAG: sigma-70 family RNA polymerase sigma factor [Acidobacteriota bacterium]
MANSSSLAVREESSDVDQIIPPSEFAGKPPEALDLLYRDHHGIVFAAAYRITGSAADAEDVLHTVFLRLLRRGNAANAPATIDNPESYLRRSAVNAALDVVRARRESVEVELDRMPSSRPNPEQTHVAQYDLGKQLREALAKLPTRWAEVFTLRHIEDQKNPEIAKALGISTLLVGVILHRARRKLQQELRLVGARA